ncbi:MAG: Zinc ABC transporter, substrate-binding protein ZnuA, partial [uncultured Thermoleophilia bacterium]
PNDFEPGPRQAEVVSRARLLVAVGAGFDAWVDDLAAGAGGDPAVVEVAPQDELRPAGAGHEEAMEGHDHGGGGHEHAEEGDEAELDPHFWHDPRLARGAVDAVEAALAAADPGGAEAYRAGATRYRAELAELDRALAERYGTVPAARRRLVTNHDAFSYLARRYGLEVVGTVIPSTSTAAEPNARDTAALIRAIRDQGVPAIFSESTVDPKLGRQLAAETGVTVYADLLGDTLAPEGEPGADYLSMMRRNADTIVEGLTR